MKCKRCKGEGRITIDVTIVDKKKNKKSTTQSQANVMCPDCVGTGNEQPKKIKR